MAQPQSVRPPSQELRNRRIRDESFAESDRLASRLEVPVLGMRAGDGGESISLVLGL